MTVFWVVSPVMVLAALGILFVRKAVHAALLLAVVMIGLSALYLSLNAPFLALVQVAVYMGAILMLFLFVLMLVGVDSSDSVVETIKGQRFMAILGGLAIGALLVVGIAQVGLGAAVGLDQANAEGNVPAIADLLFSRYVFLLITAAMGAMVLAHRERLEPKATQASLAAARLQDYAASGKHPGPLPTPGVFARHNAVDTPALLPDGTASEASVSRVLAARGTVRSAPAMADDIAGVEKQLGRAPHAGRDQSAPASTEEEAPAT
jgi:NADH-quinone oxidoreductase subunit J